MPARAESRRRSGHRLVGHTADLIVEAWGPDLAGCLEEAVRGTVASFADVRGLVAQTAVPFEIDAHDDGDAAVALLEELIYLVDVDRAVPVDVHVEVTTTPDGGWHECLRGTFEMAPLEGVRTAGAFPKAVSWHALSVAPDDAGTWRARITLDV